MKVESQKNFDCCKIHNDMCIGILFSTTTKIPLCSTLFGHCHSIYLVLLCNSVHHLNNAFSSPMEAGTFEELCCINLDDVQTLLLRPATRALTCSWLPSLTILTLLMQHYGTRGTGLLLDWPIHFLTGLSMSRYLRRHARGCKHVLSEY